MARYVLTEQSFIDNQLLDAGTEVSYDGVPGSNLSPLDDDARAAVAKAEADGVKTGTSPDYATRIKELEAENAALKAAATGDTPAKAAKGAKAKTDDTGAADLA